MSDGCCDGKYIKDGRCEIGVGCGLEMVMLET